ncbi:MAG TPA: hypothetical protein VN894_15620 [Polyangiaceae bacterium]|nr:hypothetical protein [Polyangiaceae bacterium]
MVLDAAAQDAVFTQEVADFAHGTDDGNELRRKAHVGLGLTPLDTVEALVRLVEPRVGVCAASRPSCGCPITRIAPSCCASTSNWLE